MISTREFQYRHICETSSDFIFMFPFRAGSRLSYFFSEIVKINFGNTLIAFVTVYFFVCISRLQVEFSSRHLVTLSRARIRLVKFVRFDFNCVSSFPRTRRQMRGFTVRADVVVDRASWLNRRHYTRGGKRSHIFATTNILTYSMNRHWFYCEKVPFLLLIISAANCVQSQ